MDERQEQQKLESIINSYIRAIELGLGDAKVVRHVCSSCFKPNGVMKLELYNRSGIEPQTGSDRLEHLASVQAFKRKDFKRAEEICQSHSHQPR